VTPDELIAEARRELAKGRELMEALVSVLAQRRLAGEGLTKAETKAFNRACYALRYAADCAHRSRLKAPSTKGRRRSLLAWLEKPFVPTPEQKAVLDAIGQKGTP
jgi:hypothetical protein